MRTPRCVVLAMMAFTMIVAPAMAADAVDPSAPSDPSAATDDQSILTSGTLEFGPSLSFNRSTFSPVGGGDAISNTHMNFEATVGRCMSERFELTGSFLAQHRALGNDGRDSYGASIGGILNFEQKGNLVPFVSASVGAISFDANGQTDKALLLPMLRVGFRTMIGAARSLNVSVGYQHENNSESLVEESANLFEVGVGISFFHPRSQ